MHDDEEFVRDMYRMQRAGRLVGFTAYTRCCLMPSCVHRHAYICLHESKFMCVCVWWYLL
jgi:hypothetical protein